MIHRFLLRLVAMLVFAAALSGCGALRSMERSTSYMFFSNSTEQQLGTQYAEQIQGEYTLVDDPVAQEWLERTGARLVEESPKVSQEFRFYLTDSREVNAFAIPGGHCYVNVGLILYADNEAQVAAVVGHEINHVTRRHGMVHMQRAMGLELVVVGIGTFFNSTAAQAAALATQGGGYLALQSFGRDDEREADALGVEAMYNAGWDPREGAKFFEKLHALSGGTQPGFIDRMLSTHPASTERVKNIEKQIAGYDLVSVPLVVDTPEFQAMKARLEAIYGAPADEEGVVQEE